MSIGIWQIAIVVILVVLLFGRGKISSLMGDVAKGIFNGVHANYVTGPGSISAYPHVWVTSGSTMKFPEENNFAKISNSNNVKTNYMYERNYILINIIGVTMFFYQKLLLDKISDEIKI